MLPMDHFFSRFLSAAFDTIDHSNLLCRLEQHFGIVGKPLQWMKSYLCERHQTVCVNGELSKPVRMTFSVPQGSVLGPKNCIMYTKPVGAICRKHKLNIIYTLTIRNCTWHLNQRKPFHAMRPCNGLKHA
jgi:hypothetical protein